MIRLAKDIKDVLAKAGFNLTKWICNKKEVLEALPGAEQRQSTNDLAKPEQTSERALGVQWNLEEDAFSYKVH